MSTKYTIEAYNFYKKFDLDTKEFLKDKATSIREKHQTIVEEIISLGSNLLEVKERLSHGEFGQWLELELQCSHQTANN